MIKVYVLLISFIALFFFPHKPTITQSQLRVHPDTLKYPDELHFKNIRQLTFGGDNAEAYFSFDEIGRAHV